MLLRLHGTRTVVALAFAVPLVVLLASVRTSVGFWDAGDLQTVVWIAGIPYPTGFPGYVLLGWLWTHVLPFGSVAARVNALSAVAVAGGAATVTAVALLFEALPLLAILGGWTFAFAHTVWFRASYADVHPLGFAVAFVAVALAVRWALRGERRALARRNRARRRRGRDRQHDGAHPVRRHRRHARAPLARARRRGRRSRSR